MSYLLTCPNCGVREVTDFAFGGELNQPPARAPHAARARHLQLLPPQRGGRPARVVVPPLRLPRVVHRRARHAHQRRALDGAARRGAPRHEPAPAAARRAHRPLRVRSASPSTASASRRSRATPSPPPSTPAGQRTFSRSFKYHRRRGLLCCAGQCPNCLVAVDGAPGVRACTEPVREGMAVEHLNASPSLEHDVMAVTDAVGGPFTPPGFYYKTFIRPRRLWPLYEKVLRHAAGLGRLRASQDEREWRTEYRRRHADVLVVGGGLAGLRGRDRRRRGRRRRRAGRRGPRARRARAGRGRPRARARAGRAGPRAPASRSSPRPRRWAPSTASSPSGRPRPCTRSARASSSSPPASSSSRSSSPATTCPA